MVLCVCFWMFCWVKFGYLSQDASRRIRHKLLWRLRATEDSWASGWQCPMCARSKSRAGRVRAAYHCVTQQKQPPLLHVASEATHTPHLSLSVILTRCFPATAEDWEGTYGSMSLWTRSCWMPVCAAISLTLDYARILNNRHVSSGIFAADSSSGNRAVENIRLSINTDCTRGSAKCIACKRLIKRQTHAALHYGKACRSPVSRKKCHDGWL